MLVDLDALTAQDKRRLTFYAEKIILGIKEISDLELAADADGVANKIDACRNLAGRFTTASQELGLTTDEARRYFLVQFVSTYTGRLPNAMVDDTGTFDLNALFSGNAEPPKPRPTNPDDIVDLLRNETIRGTATPN
ncbi:hypothetical protein [Yoonia sp.]|uniref:hypothetical protein n=1 Tax=Yoonia sp. TaxID=2212373 RepID=UPI001A0FB2AA|nr:hypothetical protein [Yoonia sp.]MBE0413541.1 hypothetical protein [Yoonia sp.]